MFELVVLLLLGHMWGSIGVHHVVPLARISLTLSRHFSTSFIASGRSSGLPPVSSHSCWMYVRAGRPAFAWPYVGFHRSTSLMNSSLLLKQSSACLIRQTWIVFVIGGWLSIIWKSDLTDKMKCCFFQAAVVSILLYRCTTWMLTERLEKKLDGSYTRMLRAILNKSWRQHPTRHPKYYHEILCSLSKLDNREAKKHLGRSTYHWEVLSC